MAKQTNRDRIISFFETFSEGINDGALAEQAGIKTRQQVNAICRDLESKGLLSRFVVNGTIQNFWIGTNEETESPADKQKLATPPSDLDEQLHKDNWFTKSSIQASVVKFLGDKNFNIQFDSENESHQKEIDIIAEKNQRFLCVSVKGYPNEESVESSVSLAVNLFQQAMFDMIRYRQRDKKFLLAVALPDFPVYKSMLPKVVWFKDAAKFNYLWVNKDGSVAMD